LLTINNQSLASECLWPRVCVAGWDGVVDVDQDTGVGGLVSTGESNQVRGCRAATSGNIELSTRQVELSATLASSGMKSNVLVAHQVLARRDALWDRDVVVGGS
jgi:hypothetical protein